MANQYWGKLIHLGFNFWYDEDAVFPDGRDVGDSIASSKLRCERPLWNDIIDRGADRGMNMVVIDLGEGVRYESHPEIAAEGAWTVEELRAELARLRAIGITPIPKLNFSLTHNKWLGPYKRLPTSDIYNKVCVDLIHEVCDIFDTPPMFHLGMDEEEAPNNKFMQYAMFRQKDLWWSDLYRLFDACRYKGVRPAVWSDYANHHLDEFMERMPKDVVQFQWYYHNFWGNTAGDFVDLDDPRYERGELCSACAQYLHAFRAFDRAGMDIVPTGWRGICKSNFRNMTEFCGQVLSREHILGFMQTSWLPVLEKHRDKHMETIDLLGEAKRHYESRF